MPHYQPDRYAALFADKVARALGSRPPTDQNMGVQFRIVQDADSQDIRMHSLKSLWRARYLEPEVIMLVRWLVENETPGELKDMAIGMLNSLASSR